MNGNLALADKVIIAGFFVVMLSIGIYYSAKMRDLASYFSGGRQVPWWLSGISLYMTSFSAFTFVAYSELAYKYGMVAVTIWWFMVPCILISAYFFAARWRRAASTSPLEYVETRYGPGLRQGLAWLGVPLIIVDDGLKLFALGKLVSISLGFNLELAIFLSGSIMLAYTFLGGLWAVLVTDFVQFVVLLAVVIVLVPLALAQVGGFEGFVGHMPHGFFTPFAGNYTPYFILAFFAVQVCAYATKWPYVQRYYSVATDGEARRVGYTVAVLTFIGPVVMFLPAMAARSFLHNVVDTKDVYALLCKALLPAGMIGMLISAMFSSTMSNLSGDYNAVAAVITRDIYQRLFARKGSEKSLLFAGRIATIFIGCLAMGIGFLVARAGAKNDLFVYIAALLGVLVPPSAIPMMFGLLSKRVSSAGGLAGFIAGSTCGIVAFGLSQLGSIGALHDVGFVQWASRLSDVRYMVWITSVPTLCGMYLFTRLCPSSIEQQERIGHFLDGLNSIQAHKSQAEEKPVKKNQVSPIPVIGTAITALGLIVAIMALATIPLKEAVVTTTVGMSMAVLGFACILLGRRIR